MHLIIWQRRTNNLQCNVRPQDPTALCNFPLKRLGGDAQTLGNYSPLYPRRNLRAMVLKGVLIWMSIPTKFRCLLERMMILGEVAPSIET